MQGYLGQQQAATLPVPAAALNPAAAVSGGKATSAGAYGAALSNQQQLEWDAAETMEHCNASCGAASGSSDEGGAAIQLPPCCRRPLKTLDLFPTKSTGLKDECSSSKSSSCSTSTN